MVGVRNKISSLRAGGPRQFSELRDKFVLVVDEGSEREVMEELNSLRFKTKTLNNSSIVIAEPLDSLGDVLRNVRDQLSESSNMVSQAISEVDSVGDGELLDASRSTVRATADLLNVVQSVNPVRLTDFVYTSTDYGPENLRISPSSVKTITDGDYDRVNRTLDDLNESLNMNEAWEHTRGEGVAVAVFDTAFSEDMFPTERLVGEWHGEDVDSVFKSEEGHGAMCAGASLASKEDGLPYNGTAPESDVILVRITDDDGQIRSDYIAEAWDWITDLSYDGPIVSNHSYGTPLCTGRPRGKFCNDALSEVIEIANSSRNLVSVYAAGNEANYCGRRPSGISNGITGHNSLQSVVTVGAARYDMRDIQQYSSHGRGDCAPISDPKPNVCCPLPSYVYYGGEDGWEIMDMSAGIGGSNGGTSHASPSVAGMIALIQSKALDERGEPMQTEEIKNLIHKHSELPRKTQASIASGLIGGGDFDARFGHGSINIVEALEDI